MNRYLLVATGVVAGFGGISSADVTYLTQSRAVSVSSQVPLQAQCNDTRSAADFAPFKASAHCESRHVQGGTSIADASHASMLAPDGVFASGVGSADWVQGGGSMGGYSVFVRSDIDITFRVDAATSFDLNLDYLISNGQFAPAGPFFTLTGPAGFAPISLSTLTADVHEGGQLPAGDYQLMLSVGRGASFPNTEMDMNFDLALQFDVCLADFNNDALVNSGDFFTFLAAFFSGDPSADFNRDGAVDSRDFFDFLPVFFAGC